MWVLEKTFSSCQCSSWEMNQWRDLAATTDRSPSKVDSAETRGRGRAPATQVLWGRTKEEVAAGEKLVNSAPTPRREIRWRKLQVNSGEAVGWESNNINNKNRNDKKWGMNASPPTGRLFCSYSCRLGLGHLCVFFPVSLRCCRTNTTPRRRHWRLESWLNKQPTKIKQKIIFVH